jgi:ribosomal silencing factor RsfS
MKRICIYTKDVQLITGKSERQARNILMNIREAYVKQKHQPVTIDEFCEYMDFDISKISPLIR